MKYTVLKKNNRNAIKSVKITSNCKKKKRKAFHSNGLLPI